MRSKISAVFGGYKKLCSTHEAQSGIAIVRLLELLEAQLFIPVPVEPLKNTLGVLP
jgi:hypothetical protein